MSVEQPYETNLYESFVCDLWNITLCKYILYHNFVNANSLIALYVFIVSMLYTIFSGPPFMLAINVILNKLY